MNDSLNNTINIQQGLLALFLDLHWFEIIGNLWRIGRKVIRGLASEGVYEVLD